MIKVSTAARLSTLVLAIVSASAAHAFNFDLLSQGNYTLGSGSYSVNETLVYQNFAEPMPTLTSMTYTVQNATLDGLGTYTNGTDSFTYSFTLTGDIPTDSGSDTQAAHGLWAFVSGTGGFAGIASGSGVISVNYNAPLGATSLTALSGDLTPVPEP